MCRRGAAVLAPLHACADIGPGAAGIHVVTPNKRLGSGPAREYQAAMQAARSGGGMFFSEARHPGAPLCGCMHGSRAQFIGGAGRRTARA